MRFHEFREIRVHYMLMVVMTPPDCWKWPETPQYTAMYLCQINYELHA